MFNTTKTLMRQVVLYSIIMLGFHDAAANGFVQGSALEKSGGVILDNADGLKLDREKLTIRLQQDGYQAAVRYEVTAASPYQGKLYFPMICSSPYIQQCIKSISVKLDGKPVEVNHEQQDGVAGIFGENYKVVAWDKLKKYGYFPEDMEYEELTEEQVNQRLKVKVVTAPLVSSGKNFVLDVVYEVNYLSFSSGTSKSAIYSYSDDIVYYDFTPAGLWAKNRVKSLAILIEEDGVGNAFTTHGGWGFKREKRGYSIQLHNVVMADIEPIILGVEQTGFHRYRDFQRNIEYHNERRGTGFNLTSTDTIQSKDRRYDADKAMDGNFATAWCSSEEKASITITLPESEEHGCWLEGVAVFNGYAKNRNIWQANNRVKSLKLTISGVSRSGEELVSSRVENIEDGSADYANNPFQMMRFIPVTASGRDAQKKITIELQILDVYKGASYNDTCISELMPVYNCG